MNIYENCPVLENEKFIIRLFMNEDCDDLLEVYSDKNALPFFNSDNCDGDNFYYATKERMTEAIDFWNMSYRNGWFVRLSVVVTLPFTSNRFVIILKPSVLSFIDILTSSKISDNISRFKPRSTFLSSILNSFTIWL